MESEKIGIETNNNYNTNTVSEVFVVFCNMSNSFVIVWIIFGLLLAREALSSNVVS